MYADTIPYRIQPWHYAHWVRSRSFLRINYRILYRIPNSTRGELPTKEGASRPHIPSFSLRLISSPLRLLPLTHFLSQYRLLEKTILSSPVEYTRTETKDCFLHTLLTLFVDIGCNTTILDIAAAPNIIQRTRKICYGVYWIIYTILILFRNLFQTE